MNATRTGSRRGPSLSVLIRVYLVTSALSVERSPWKRWPLSWPTFIEPSLLFRWISFFSALLFFVFASGPTFCLHFIRGLLDTQGPWIRGLEAAEIRKPSRDEMYIYLFLFILFGFHTQSNPQLNVKRQSMWTKRVNRLCCVESVILYLLYTAFDLSIGLPSDYGFISLKCHGVGNINMF